MFAKEDISFELLRLIHRSQGFFQEGERSFGVLRFPARDRGSILCSLEGRGLPRRQRIISKPTSASVYSDTDGGRLLYRFRLEVPRLVQVNGEGYTKGERCDDVENFHWKLSIRFAKQNPLCLR